MAAVTRNNANTDEWWSSTPLSERCIRTHGWSGDYARRVLIGYKQFLELKVVFSDWGATQLSPSVPVDQMWHLHILDNRNYRKDCLLLCNGREVFHNPDGDADVQARQQRIAHTKIALTARFGDQIDGQVWNFGRDDNRHNQTSDDDDTGERVEDNCMEVENGSATITISVLDQTGEETFFKMGRDTPLSKVFNAYAAKKGTCSTSLKYMLGDERVNGDDTPRLLKMEDMDQFFCYLEQTGC